MVDDLSKAYSPTGLSRGISSNFDSAPLGKYNKTVEEIASCFFCCKYLLFNY